MAFSHRMAALAAVVLIPVGIAGTSYLLSDDPAPPAVPSDVELEEPSPPGTPPREEVAPRPDPTEGPIDENHPQNPDSPTGGGQHGDDDFDDDGPDDDGPDDDGEGGDDLDD
ncbi:hypothetical protein [Streptomyces marincola]|uniref:Small secreted hydrophilic protein n=1 Tax=Streptomyces marincola TaxID=2878388 RepID=A0A1W7CUB1_9ACTN|nr:hypothetical protein [Streptomyces marincola]ARQ68332.1 hypothetical protein CAG99_05255 [Streptomyces marincola]